MTFFCSWTIGCQADCGYLDLLLEIIRGRRRIIDLLINVALRITKKVRLCFWVFGIMDCDVLGTVGALIIDCLQSWPRPQDRQSSTRRPSRWRTRVRGFLLSTDWRLLTGGRVDRLMMKRKRTNSRTRLRVAVVDDKLINFEPINILVQATSRSRRSATTRPSSCTLSPSSSSEIISSSVCEGLRWSYGTGYGTYTEIIVAVGSCVRWVDTVVCKGLR